MIKKTAKIFWEHRRQFGRYFTVGITTFGLDLGSLIVLKERLNFTPLSAVILNQLLVIAFNFNLNKHWSFKEVPFSHKQLWKYLVLIGFNYFFSVAAMFVFNEHMGIDYRLVRVGSIGVMVIWNFLIYKYWVYTHHTK